MRRRHTSCGVGRASRTEKVGSTYFAISNSRISDTAAAPAPRVAIACAEGGAERGLRSVCAGTFPRCSVVDQSQLSALGSLRWAPHGPSGTFRTFQVPSVGKAEIAKEYSATPSCVGTVARPTTKPDGSWTSIATSPDTPRKLASNACGSYRYGKGAY